MMIMHLSIDETNLSLNHLSNYFKFPVEVDTRISE